MNLIQYIHIAFELWAAVFCIIAAICVFAARVFEPTAARSLISLLITDAVLNITEIVFYSNLGKASAAASTTVEICTFLITELRFLLVSLAASHIDAVTCARGGNNDRDLTKLTFEFSAIGGFVFAFVVLADRYYHWNSIWIIRDDFEYIIPMIVLLLAHCPIIIRVFRNRKNLRKLEYIAFLFFVIVPSVGGIIQSVYRNISAYNIANSIALIIVVLIHQLDYAEDTIRIEKTRADEKLRFYHSQIQPHIIFNSLTAIRSYIPIDSRARELLDDFTGFLRGRLDMLQETGCVEASREFEVVEDYLSLATGRYGEKLLIKMDIRDQDFLIPPFTVQTLAENAIKHGIMQREDGSGVLEVKSYEDKDNHIIEVIDDGVGFDTAILDDLANRRQSGDSFERKPLGIYIVRERLSMMCGGRLEIESRIMKGTRARIIIPKEK